MSFVVKTSVGTSLLVPVTALLERSHQKYENLNNFKLHLLNAKYNNICRTVIKRVRRLHADKDVRCSILHGIYGTMVQNCSTSPLIKTIEPMPLV